MNVAAIGKEPQSKLYFGGHFLGVMTRNDCFKQKMTQQVAFIENETSSSFSFKFFWPKINTKTRFEFCSLAAIRN